MPARITNTGLLAGLTKTDRRLLLGAGAVTILMLGLSLAFGVAQRGEESPVPSSYSSDPGGALAAYLMLQDLASRYSDREVMRWEQSPTELPDGEGALLILAQPTELAEVAERAAINEFVSSGGRVLFCGPLVGEFLRTLGPGESEIDPEWKNFEPRLPNALTRDVNPIVMRPLGYFGERSPSQIVLAGEDDAAVMVVWRLGAGEVIWWAGATPLTNSGITQGENLRLLLNVVRAETGSPLDIYWDEYFHGARGSLWTYVQATPLPWGMLQIGLLAAAVVFTFSRRSGPVAIPGIISRLSPLEFVDTMGGLYERAGAESIAVEVSYKHLRLELARRLRMSADSSDEALSEAAGQRLGIDAAELTGTLLGVRQAMQTSRPDPKESLRLVQQMKRCLIGTAGGNRSASERALA